MRGRQVLPLALAYVLAAYVPARAADRDRGGRPDPAAPCAPSTRVVVELFQVALADAEVIRYRRDVHDLDARGPDAILADMMSGPGNRLIFSGKPAILHSTSWRYEKDGSVVLTYLAFGEGVARASTVGTASIRKDDLPELRATDPDRPRPATIKYADVLAHGLRHLALLARRKGNDAFRQRLGALSRDFFASVEPDVAGEIRDGFSSPSEAR